MANVVYPSNGLITVLQALANTNMNIRIFTNNYTPVDASVKTSFTEATFAGYSANFPLTLTGANWVSLGVSGGVGTLAYPTITVTNSSAGTVTVYGWYILDSTNTYVIAAGLFDGAPVSILAGATYSWIPTLGDQSQY